MKYVVLLCDGMADLPREDLTGKTPMGTANKPNMDKLAKVSEVGLVKGGKYRHRYEAYRRFLQVQFGYIVR